MSLGWLAAWHTVAPAWLMAGFGYAVWLVPLCPSSRRSGWHLGEPVVVHWLSEVMVLVKKSFLGCGGLELPGCAMQFLGDGWIWSPGG